MSSGNPNLEPSPFVVHVGSESLTLIDIPVDSYSYSKFPLEPLVYLHNFPIELCQEVGSSLRPFLKIPLNPQSFEAHNHILLNIMANLGGGRVGGNQLPLPSLKPWVMDRFGPLNLLSHVHDLPENYLNLLPKYNGKLALFVE
jgi:hypothetical protein